MCFSASWFFALFVWIILICAGIAILQVVVPYFLSKVLPKANAEVSEGVGIVAQVVRIIIWAAILIGVLYICFALFECLVQFAGGFPRLR